MALVYLAHLIALLSLVDRELEKRDHVVGHELRSNRTAHEGGILLRTECHVLHDLHDANLVITSLRLNGDDVVGTTLVNSDIQLVSLDLADSLDGGAEVVLEAYSRPRSMRPDG